MKQRGLPGALRQRLESLVEESKNPVADALSHDIEPRGSARVRKSKAQSFADLDAYITEARAGMPDAALGRVAGASPTAVVAWRKARGVKRRAGYRGRLEADTWAVDAFGDSYTPGLQLVSPTTKAQWDLPEYTLRKALDYDTLCRIIHHVSSCLGMTEEQIASGLGLRPRDVEMALAVETNYLLNHGTSCTACGTPCDLRFGKVCSSRCLKDSMPE